jgi:hypothetical protein
MTIQLPGEKVTSVLPERRRYLVPLDPDVSAAVLERLGGTVHPGTVRHLEIEAESRSEARLLAAELVELAVTT